MNLFRKYVRPEVDHLVADFTKLEKKLGQVVKRKLARIPALNDAKAEIEHELAVIRADVARAERISRKILDLVE